MAEAAASSWSFASGPLLPVSPPAGTEAEHMNTHHTQDSDGRGVRGVTRARKTPSQASAHTLRGCRLRRGPRSFPGLWRLFVFMPGSLCAGPLRVHLPPGGPPPPDVHLAPSLERPSLTTPCLPNPLNGTTPPPPHSQRRRHRNTCLCPFYPVLQPRVQNSSWHIAGVQ